MQIENLFHSINLIIFGDMSKILENYKVCTHKFMRFQK